MSATTIDKRIEIELHPAQQSFRKSEALYRGFVGGRGSGKTWAGAYDLICRGKPGCTYLVASPTSVMLADITLPKFRSIAEHLQVWNHPSLRLSPYPTVRLLTGATIRFRSAEDPEKMRGPDYSGVWLDEASLMDRQAFDVAIGCLREAGKQGWLSATFTPKGMSHWTYEVFGNNPPRPDTAIFCATSHDNPFLPAGFAAGLVEQYSGLRAAQEVGGRFVNVEGAEWPAEYFGERIWYDEVPADTRIVRSILAVDTSKGKLTGDYQALVLARLDEKGNFWCDAEAHKLDEVQLLAKVLELLDRWRPDLTVVETNGAGYYLLGQIHRANVGGGRPCVIGREHTSATNKQARINTRLTSQWARGTIRLRKVSQGTKLLLAEARDFPQCEHDDLLDALEMAMEAHGEFCRPRAQRRALYEFPR